MGSEYAEVAGDVNDYINSSWVVKPCFSYLCFRVDKAQPSTAMPMMIRSPMIKRDYDDETESGPLNVAASCLAVGFFQFVILPVAKSIFNST